MGRDTYLRFGRGIQTVSNELPQLDACIDLYSDIWDVFGTDHFETEALIAELRERAPGDTHLPDDPRRYLELLVAYGLLDRITEESYCVRCPPNETERAWQDRFVDRAEQLYTAARAVHEERTRSDERHITFRDRTYVSIGVTDETTVETVGKRITELVEMDRLRAGIVLCCPADQASIAQSIADDLGTPNETEMVSPFVFEKVNSEVTGADTDALQFRLYVAPIE